MPKWCPATIVEKKIWTDGLFTLTLNAPDVSPFEPGQFLQLAVTEGDERTNRPYSVASPHGDHLEFFIVLVEDGQLTPKLWGLSEGDTLEVAERAAGSFTLKKSPRSDVLWLLSTGTGLAPYIAMLRTPEPWENYDKICVIHGARHKTDLAYTEEMMGYQQQYPGRFKLIQALTREESEGTLSGRIPALLENGQLEEEAGVELQATNSTVLLCGNPAMLDDMEEKLGQRDMKRHRTKAPGQIVLERYW
ncbi:MAG: ferredoxin--NADP reductase [Mariniblastus sp.]|nr:ferredoxin--NADP reductase [Mariniblastus sp.]